MIQLIIPHMLLLLMCCVQTIGVTGSPWRVWSSARPRRDNDTRYQFVVYTREAPAGPSTSTTAAGSRGRQVDAVGAAPVLPPGIASQHDEHQVGG